MYFYVAFFNENSISRKKFYLTGQYMEPFKLIFPTYHKLNETDIEGCIGFLKGKENLNKNCFVLNIRNIKTDNNSISFEFEVEKELDVTNEFVDKSLYKFARQSNWINKDSKYYPILCVLEKVDFDTVRKGTPNMRKLSSNSVKIDEFREQGNWDGICSLYEPLEKLCERDDVWNNVSDLYNLAFACSKLGEPQNGMERDRNHLEKVKRYRDLSITFFKRCCDIEPDHFRYASSLAYRYYLNVMELSKPKGRRDGKVSDEISEAIAWLDKALEINPNSIKDNYRKGKLILDKKIENFKYSQKEWTKETFLELDNMEQPSIVCLEKVIERYENLASEDDKKRYCNEFVKALYCLGCYYAEKPKVMWNEYACYKMLHKNFDLNITREDMEYIAKARRFFEKCFQAESNISLDSEFDYVQLSQVSKDWVISPMDKLYRLGLVYLEMYFMKRIMNNDNTKIDIYGHKAENYLNSAKAIGDILKRKQVSGRNTWFISEKLAWYYIFCENYGRSIQLIERSHDSYIKNTYAIALLLSDLPEKFQKAEEALNVAASDAYNKARDISLALLAYLYKLNGEKEKLGLLITDKKEKLSNSSKKLVSLLEKGEDLL